MTPLAERADEIRAFTGRGKRLDEAAVGRYAAAGARWEQALSAYRAEPTEHHRVTLDRLTDAVRTLADRAGLDLTGSPHFGDERDPAAALAPGLRHWLPGDPERLLG